jgi:hypothetical protein
MIELDAPEPGPQRSAAGHRWRRPVAAVALLAAGVALGSVVTYRWQAQRVGAAPGPAVVLFIPPLAGLVDNTSTVTTDWGDSELVEIPAHVAVANVSPVPLTVPEFVVEQPGLTLSGSLNDRWIRPGESSVIKVAVRVVCDTGYPVGSVRAALSVETDDGARRTSAESVIFDGSSWNARMDPLCHPAR